VRQLEGHEDRVTALAFTTDGQTVASAAMDMKVHLWQVSSARLLGALEGGTDEAATLVFQSEGDWLAGASADGTVRIWRHSAWSQAHP
jgi:WD40 repeat protein